MSDIPGRLMLCTDLDRTLLPNGPQPESKTARSLFRCLAAQPAVVLVYVTGRHRVLVNEAILEYQLPMPDYVIGDVGSSIYEITDEEWLLMSTWSDYISHDWADYGHDDIAELIADTDGLTLQEAEKQNTYKLSYYFSTQVSLESLIDKIEQQLHNKGLNINIIWSVDETSGAGLLDILPGSASKRQAIEFLMQHLDYNLTDVVFAGDSGNDISVMTSEIPSILVANATEEVRKDALSKALKNGQSDRLYLAGGGYLGMNGNYSAGILEGVGHYRPDIHQWLTTL